MPTTAYNVKQKRGKLMRELVHFNGQIDRYATCTTPQEKKIHTTAVRCYRERLRLLIKLTS